MPSCASPDCEAAGTVQGKFSVWCPDHAAILTRVRGTKAKRSKAIKFTKAGQAELDDANARKIAKVVQAQDVPVTGLPQRTGIQPRSDAWKAAVALAKQRGWVKVDQGRGFVSGPNRLDDKTPAAAPPKLPPRERALKLAQAVHAADGRWLSSEDALKAADCSARSLGRVVKVAREEGWLRTQRGRGGYYATDVPLPQEA